MEFLINTFELWLIIVTSAGLGAGLKMFTENWDGDRYMKRRTKTLDAKCHKIKSSWQNLESKLNGWGD